MTGAVKSYRICMLRARRRYGRFIGTYVKDLPVWLVARIHISITSANVYLNVKHLGDRLKVLRPARGLGKDRKKTAMLTHLPVMKTPIALWIRYLVVCYKWKKKKQFWDSLQDTRSMLGVNRGNNNVLEAFRSCGIV